MPSAGVCDTAPMESHALPAAAPALPDVDVPVWAWALVELAAVAPYCLASLGGLAAAWTGLALVTGTLLSRPASTA